MSKVTGKLQMAVCKALARRYGFRPGDSMLPHTEGDVDRKEIRNKADQAEARS